MSVYKKENPEHLKESIQSVLNQTCRCNDFVIVEDGPLTKELNKVINSFQRKHSNLIHIVKLKENKGLGIALKEGMNHCKNELVARFDSDDISVPDRCEKQLKMFQMDESLDIVGSRHIEFINSTDNVVSHKDLPLTDKDIKEYAKRRNPMSHSAVMYKKSKVIEAGNYQNYYYLEDYDLWVRMMKNNCKFMNMEDYLSYVRVSEDLYKRRGGMKYLKSILKFKNELYKDGFYSFKDYMVSSTAHIAVCLMPGDMRQFVYKKFLRK